MQIRYRFSGARVRAERKRRHLSLDQLAAMIGVTPPFLGQIELGRRKPSLETFERLLAVFKEKPESLMVTDACGGDGVLRCEERIRALLHGQPPERQEVLLRTLKFVLRQFPDAATARARKPALARAAR